MKSSSAIPAPLAQASSTDHPVRSLIRVFGMLRRVMEPYFARHGISGSQWGVLRSLRRAEEDGTPAMRLTDLSNRLLVRPPSVTTVVERLQRIGLIERVTSQDDQRVKQVRLTAPGRKLVLQVLRHHPEQMESILTGLNERERQELQRMLGVLGDRLHDMIDKSSTPNGNGAAKHKSASAKRRGRT